MLKALLHEKVLWKMLPLHGTIIISLGLQQQRDRRCSCGGALSSTGSISQQGSLSVNSWDPQIQLLESKLLGYSLGTCATLQSMV